MPLAAVEFETGFETGTQLVFGSAALTGAARDAATVARIGIAQAFLPRERACIPVASSGSVQDVVGGVAGMICGQT